MYYNHCEVTNFYRHPRPEPKRRRFIDTVKVEKFTVNRIKESCIEKCCEPMPVGVSVKNSALILHGITECIQPDTYYTFDLDRSVPIDFNALQVFMKIEPCEMNFFHGAVELEETEITVPFCKNPRFKFTEENLREFYQAKYRNVGEEEDEEDRRENREHRKIEEFLEVDLDLRGNIAVSGDFLRNERGPSPEFGRKHKYVLYMNTAGRLVLTRDCRTTRKYGDFDL